MDTSIFLDYLMKGLGSASATLLITFATILFTKLKGKITDVRINNFIKQVVQAAEQLYPNNGQKMGTVKYNYVWNEVVAKFPKMKDNPHLKSLIEGAVYTVSEQIRLIAKENNEVAQTSIIKSR